MTFTQAVETKEMNEPFFKDGLNYEFMVVPFFQEDILKWLRDYRKSDEIFTDDLAKKYSSNNQFKIMYVVSKDNF